MKKNINKKLISKKKEKKKKKKVCGPQRNRAYNRLDKYLPGKKKWAKPWTLCLGTIPF
jgi:hypothetical protein